MYSVPCPLEPHAFAEVMLPLRLDQVKMMENHIATSCHHPPVREFICHGEFAGTTPLLLACAYGQLDSVKRIVQVWGVDVLASAVYFYRSIKIDASTPLFVAASCGHVEIVRYLLEKGANVAAKTECASHGEYDGLTPLYGAFYNFADKSKTPLILRLLLEAGADPNTLPSWLKYTRDSEEATLLINHGLDLTLREPTYSYTILHHWASVSAGGVAEEQSLSVVKLLVDKGADLLALSNLGFTPILMSAVFLNFKVLEYFLERDGVPRMDKINALEIAGAVILGDTEYASLRPKAFDYWRRALQLRQLENEKGGPLIKTPLKFEHVKTVEWVTVDELEDVIHHPSEYMVHSFLLKLRIVVSCEIWLTIDRFLSSLSGKHLLLDQPDRFAHNLDMLWATMETIRKDSSGRLSDRAHNTTEALVTMLSFIQRDHPLLLTIETMKISLQLISDTDDMAGSSVTTSSATLNYMRTLLRLVELMARLPQMLEERIKTDDNKGGTMYDILEKLVKRKRRNDYGQTLLYIACQPVLPNDARVDTIRLLIDSGADPNAVDGDGDAPLHVLAKFNGEVADAAANLLLERGAHFDRVNKSGMTAVDVWMKCNEGANGWKDRPSWCRPSNPTLLMCQCARVIRMNKVPYKEPFTLPVTLLPFIEFH